MEEDDPKPVLSEEQLDTLFKTETNWIDYARAVERAVLEAVGGQYDALNRGIIADLAPVNSQPHSYARGAVLEAVDTITALRAFHDRAIEILGAHGALDQGVEVDALTWLADVLTQADGLRARVAELERERDGMLAAFKVEVDTLDLILLNEDWGYEDDINTLTGQILPEMADRMRGWVTGNTRTIVEIMQERVEAIGADLDAARRELAEARKDNKDDPTPSGPRPWE